MILATSDNILAQLKTIPGVNTVDDWHGEIDDLLNQPGRLPGIWLVYVGARYEPKALLGTNIAQHSMAWTVVVIDKNLRRLDAAAPGCYQLIEQVRAKLIGYDTGNGWLWPVSEALIHSERGKLAYALEYTNGTETP